MTVSDSPGLVVAGYSNDYEVLLNGVAYRCVLKGVHKKSKQAILVGDYVTVDNLDNNNFLGRICDILPRKNYLNKPKVANITTMMVMASVASPAFDALQLDRYITQGFLVGLNIIIVFTKADLCPLDLDIEYYQDLYRKMGLSVLAISIMDPLRIAACLSLILNNTVVMAGLSGVGKSSFLNTLRPELNLKVGEVSHKLARGTHTTRHVSLIKVANDTFIVDTPGFSQLKFDAISTSHLKQAFPEFKVFECYYPDCDHVLFDENNQPLLPDGCYLKTHPDAISHSRFLSYQAFLMETKQFDLQQKITSQKTDDSFKTLDKTKGQKLNQLRLQPKDRNHSRRVDNQKLQNRSYLDVEMDEA